MARTPLDLTFQELADAGIEASKAARQKAERAGVPVATLDSCEDGPTKGARRRGAAKTMGMQRRTGG